MNTKTTKFLAVLAVFAIAFAAVAVISEAPLETSDADDPAIVVGVYDKDGNLVSDLTISTETTWYVDAEASITGGKINVTTGTLTIVLKDSETPSNFTIEGAEIAGKLVLSKGITMILPNTTSADKINVTGILTINGAVQNDKGITSFTLDGASAKIDGTGVIQGIVAPMLSIKSGTLTGVTISAEKWVVTEEYAGFEMVEVADSNNGNVTIDGISLMMKAGTAGAHGICVDAVTDNNTVLIKNVTFAATSGSVQTEYIIAAKDVTGTLKMEKINCDSSVIMKAGYGQFNAMSLNNIGTNVKFLDNSIESLRAAGNCTIAGSMSINTIVLKTSDGALNIATGVELKVNGGITTQGSEREITLNGTAKITNTGTTRMEGDVSIVRADGATGSLVNDGTLVMDKGATITNLVNNKTVRLYNGVIGTETGTAATGTTLVNDGTIYVMDENAVINVADKSGTGTIDTSAISEEVFIHGDISTSGTVFKWNQKVTFDGDTTLLKGASLTFYGKVIIPAGVTVTIEDGAAITISGEDDEAKALGQLNIDGTLIIEGSIWTSTASPSVETAGLKITKGEVVNNGTIELAYDGSESIAELVYIGEGTTFTNNGIITIGEKSKLTNAAKSFVNSADGVITIYGDLAGTTETDVAIQNSGLIAISSEVNVNSPITISNAAVGAEIDILMTKAAVTINDAAIKDDTEKKFVNGGNIIVLTPTNVTCGGITVTSATFKVTKTESNKSVVYTYTSLEIEGALIVSKESGDIDPVHDYAALALTSTKGRIVVADELTLTNTNLTTAADTELYVSGELTLTKDCTFANSGELTVPGIVYMIGCSINPTGTINAAMYKIPQTVLTSQVIVYTNVPDAIAGAEEASVKTVTVTGTVDIEESIIIPAGMTVKTETGSAVTIVEDVVVEVYSDGIEFAVLNNGGTINVDGKLIYDDAKKSQKGTEPVSQVIVKSGNMVVYTTLAWAIADAGSEEATIELCGKTTITKDMTIPENITVDTNGKDFTVDGAVLTIDGVLYLDGATVYTVKGTDPKVVVNGAIISEKDTPYDGKKFPAGLYFS
ncbi:MAG: hypothetical protein IKN41_07360, partial [Candidatus Methanomethylophilaceae archaeon]|nr:hypothetical protein [Candidatus Methanomethylophilaceae archaeon]